MGCDGSLVGSISVDRRECRGFESRSIADTYMYGPWASSSLAVACGPTERMKLRHSIRAASGALLSSSELEDAL